MAQWSSLSKYRGDRLVISPADAQKVMIYLFRRAPPNLDDNDRRFAQALILSAAEATAQIGILETVWRTASSPTARPMGVLKSVAKAVLKYLARPKALVDSVDSPKYDMVITSIAYGFGGVWDARMQMEDSSVIAL